MTEPQVDPQAPPPDDPQAEQAGPGCCFPHPGELAGLAERALTGERAVPYVGDGSADTVISCGHGTWRLGDILTFDDTDTGGESGDGPRPCNEPGCDKGAAKNRKWCNTHASPANRAGGQ